MRDVQIPFGRPVGVTAADLMDFAEMAKFYAIRLDWRSSRDVLMACAVELENECMVLAIQTGEW
jgi:hypothetical protein